MTDQGRVGMLLRRLNRTILALLISGPLVNRLPAQTQVLFLIENLQADNVEVRREAAARILTSDRKLQREALPVLIDRLKNEKDGQVRLAVLDTVTALGPEAESAIPALIQTLRTDYGGQKLEETHQDYRSALALAAIGKGSVEGLRGLVNEPKENVRAEAVMALGRIGHDAGATISDLIPLLGDKSERVRREASLACGRVGPAAVDPLIAACSHTDVMVRAGAVESLGYLPAPDPRISQAVLGCTKDAAPKVRVAALKSLAKMSLPVDVVLSSLRENLHDQDAAVQRLVVDVIMASPDLLARMAPEFELFLTDENDEVARLAAFLLGRLGSDGVPRLLAALRHDKSRVNPIAAALAQTGRSSVEKLTKAVEDPDPRVRRGAALALGQIRPLAAGVVKTLTTGLNDPDPEVKAAFLAAIGELGRRASDAAPAVRNLMRDGSAAVRIQAVDVLARSAPHDDRMLVDLMAMLDDGDPRVQRQAIDAIRTLGAQGREALTIVTQKLQSPDQGVRLAAAAWIGSQGQGAAEAAPALILLLDDTSPELRVIAVQTLGKLGKAAQPAFERLTSLLATDLPKVREVAVLTISSLGLDPEVVRPALLKALQDNTPKIRAATLTAIQRLGPQGSIFVPDLIVLASKEEKEGPVKKLLRRYERKGPDVRSLPELVKQLEHDQANVRLLAVKFLGLAGQHAREAIPALERLRDDPNIDVRKQAEAACERIKNAPATDER